MNILLIRLRLIGDVVFTTPAIQAIKRQIAGARLTYLVESEAAPIVAANPHLDDVMITPRSRGVQRWKDDAALAVRLRRARFDAVIDFHGGPRALLLTLATGAPVRIGYDTPAGAFVYTDRVARPRELRARHSVENQWDLLEALDPVFRVRPDSTRDAVTMFEEADAAATVEQRLRAAGVDRHDQLLVLHVSAGNPFRRWPLDSFIDAVVELAKADRRRRIVLTSGPSDVEARARVAAEARARLGSKYGHAIVACEEFTLPQLRALIGSAALFIGGDSGPLHVAATTKTPIVGLYGPTLPARSAPWRDPAYITESVDAGELPCRPCDQRSCAPGDFRCLTHIAPQRVIEAAERALSRAATLNVAS